MKKTIEGRLFNRIEKFGDKEYKHIGFEDNERSFGDIMETIVPETGMTKKARLTIEIIEDGEKQDERG